MNEPRFNLGEKVVVTRGVYKDCEAFVHHVARGDYGYRYTVEVDRDGMPLHVGEDVLRRAAFEPAKHRYKKGDPVRIKRHDDVSLFALTGLEGVVEGLLPKSQGILRIKIGEKRYVFPEDQLEPVTGPKDRFKRGDRVRRVVGRPGVPFEGEIGTVTETTRHKTKREPGEGGDAIYRVTLDSMAVTDEPGPAFLEADLEPAPGDTGTIRGRALGEIIRKAPEITKPRFKEGDAVRVKSDVPLTHAGMRGTVMLVTPREQGFLYDVEIDDPIIKKGFVTDFGEEDLEPGEDLRKVASPRFKKGDRVLVNGNPATVNEVTRCGYDEHTCRVRFDGGPEDYTYHERALDPVPAGEALAARVRKEMGTKLCYKKGDRVEVIQSERVIGGGEKGTVEEIETYPRQLKPVYLVHLDIGAYARYVEDELTEALPEPRYVSSDRVAFLENAQRTPGTIEELSGYRGQTCLYMIRRDEYGDMSTFAKDVPEHEIEPLSKEPVFKKGARVQIMGAAPFAGFKGVVENAYVSPGGGILYDVVVNRPSVKGKTLRSYDAKELRAVLPEGPVDVVDAVDRGYKLKVEPGETKRPRWGERGDRVRIISGAYEHETGTVFEAKPGGSRGGVYRVVIDRLAAEAATQGVQPVSDLPMGTRIFFGDEIEPLPLKEDPKPPGVTGEQAAEAWMKLKPGETKTVRVLPPKGSIEIDERVRIVGSAPLSVQGRVGLVTKIEPGAKDPLYTIKLDADGRSVRVWGDQIERVGEALQMRTAKFRKGDRVEVCTANHVFVGCVGTVKDVELKPDGFFYNVALDNAAFLGQMKNLYEGDLKAEETEPRFKKGDKVEVNRGVYKGRIGYVHAVAEDKSCTIELYRSGKALQIAEEHLDLAPAAKFRKGDRVRALHNAPEYPGRFGTVKSSELATGGMRYAVALEHHPTQYSGVVFFLEQDLAAMGRPVEPPKPLLVDATRFAAEADDGSCSIDLVELDFSEHNDEDLGSVSIGPDLARAFGIDIEPGKSSIFEVPRWKRQEDEE